MSHKQKTLFQAWKAQVEKPSCSNYADPSENGPKTVVDKSLDDDGIFKIPRPVTHNELFPSEFDINACKTWIYPTNYPLRDYQFSIVKEALFKNTMVVLPTGLGKTFIAAVIMYNIYRWYPKGKVVFMAPTKPLVAQQVDSCFKVTGICEDDTTQMTGNVHPDARKQIWQRKRVFFLTPQVMANDLICNICPAESIKCLVIDEAHKALGNHSYCQVVRELLLSTSQFRVLALSATPGSDIQAVKHVIENLLISHVELRTEDSPDVLPYTHTRDIEKIVVPLGEGLTSMKSRFLDIINIYLKRLNQRKAMAVRNPSSLSKFQVLKLRETFSQHPPSNMDRYAYGLAMADFALCISLYHAYELLLFHGVRPFYNFLIGIINGDKSIPHARSELQKNFEFEEIMKTIEMDYMPRDSPKSFHSNIITRNGNFLQKQLPGHPKLVKLEQIVLDHFKTVNGELADTRVMIFSQYRDSVQEITELLDKHQPVVKVMSFIGQATTSGASVGYSQKQQLKVIEQFRKGGYNTLVSTCVGEEGLDIGEVDLIICFDSPKSPIRLVQRMGRTGRLRKGRIILLVTQGKEEQMCNSSEFKKKQLNKTITKNFSFAQFYQNNPSMIPEGLVPECVKTHITIKPKKINAKNVTKSRKNSELTDEELEEFNYLFKVEESQLPLLPNSEIISLKTAQQREELQDKRKESILSLSNWTLWQDAPQKSYRVSHSLRSSVLTETMELIHFPNTKSEPFSHKEKAKLYNALCAEKVPCLAPVADVPNWNSEAVDDDIIEIDLEQLEHNDEEAAKNIPEVNSPEVVIVGEAIDDMLIEDRRVPDSDFLFDKLLESNQANVVAETPAVDKKLKNNSTLMASLFGKDFNASFTMLPNNNKPFISPPPFIDHLSYIKAKDIASVDMARILSSASTSKTHSVLSILNKKMKAKLKRKSKEPGSVLFDHSTSYLEVSPQCQQSLKKPINVNASITLCSKPNFLPNESVVYEVTKYIKKQDVRPSELILHEKAKNIPRPDVVFNNSAPLEITKGVSEPDVLLNHLVLPEISKKASKADVLSSDSVPHEIKRKTAKPVAFSDNSISHEITKAVPANKLVNKTIPVAIEFDINFGFSGSQFNLKNYQNKAEEKLDTFKDANNLYVSTPDSNFSVLTKDDRNKKELDTSHIILSKEKDSQTSLSNVCILDNSFQNQNSAAFEDSLIDNSNDDILKQFSTKSNSIPEQLESSFTFPLKVKDVIFDSNFNQPTLHQRTQMSKNVEESKKSALPSNKVFKKVETNRKYNFQTAELLKRAETNQNEINKENTFKTVEILKKSSSFQTTEMSQPYLRIPELSKINKEHERFKNSETNEEPAFQDADMILREAKSKMKSVFETSEMLKKVEINKDHPFQITKQLKKEETASKSTFHTSELLKKSEAKINPTLKSAEMFNKMETGKENKEIYKNPLIKSAEMLKSVKTKENREINKLPAFKIAEAIISSENNKKLAKIYGQSNSINELTFQPEEMLKNDKTEEPVLHTTEILTNSEMKKPAYPRSETTKKMSFRLTKIPKNANKEQSLKTDQVLKTAELDQNSAFRAVEILKQSETKKKFRFRDADSKKLALQNNENIKKTETNKDCSKNAKELDIDKISSLQTPEVIKSTNNNKTPISNAEILKRSEIDRQSFQTAELLKKTENKDKLLFQTNRVLNVGNKYEQNSSKNNKIPVTHHTNSNLNAIIKATNNKNNLNKTMNDKESSQYTLSQILSLIDRTNIEDTCETPLKSSLTQLKKDDHSSMSSDDEVCPTPPRCLKPNLSIFSYRTNDDIKGQSFSSLISHKNTEDLPCNSGIAKFSIFGKIDNNEKILPSKTSPQKKKLTQQLCNNSVRSPSPQKFIFDMSFGCHMSDEVPDNFFADDDLEMIDEQSGKPASIVEMNTYKKDICRIESKSALQKADVSHQNIYNCLTTDNNIFNVPQCTELFKKPDDRPSLSSKQNVKEKFNAPSNLLTGVSTERSDVRIDVPKSRNTSFTSNNILSSKLSLKGNQEILSSPIRSRALQESNVSRNNSKRAIFSPNRNDDFKTKKKLKTMDSANEFSKTKKITFSIFGDSQEETIHKKPRNEFILSQAEVSGAENSNDESDDNDNLEESFIDDVHFTQSNTDQHAFYLQSIKSCAGLPQKFKLNYHNECIENVFSQPVEEDNSTYLHDSFCVDNDQVEYVESPVNKSRLKRKKNHQKRKKRRRIVALNSSSEDEGTNQKNEDPTVPAETGIEFKKSLSIAVNNAEKEHISEKNSSKSGAQIVEAEYLFKPSQYCTTKDMSEQSVSKTAIHSEISFTQSAIPSSYVDDIHSYNMLLDDSFHDIPPEIFEFKQAVVQTTTVSNISTQKIKKLPSSSQRVLNVALDTHINVDKLSFDISWNADHEKISPKTDQRNSTNSIANTKITNTSNSIITPKFTGATNIIATPKISNSSNCIAPKLSSTSNVVQNVGNDSSSKPVVILVDSRQLASAKSVISALRNTHKADPVVMQLCGVDYIISNRIAVDRIVDSEFSNTSFVSPKLLEKIRTMCESYDESYIIIEKDNRKQQVLSFNKSGNKYTDFATTILAQASTMFLYSESPEETSQLLFDLAEREKKRKFHIDVPVRSVNTNQELFNFYASLPHMNIVCALNFLYNFPSLSMFLKSSVEELKKVGFISNRRAEAILQYVKTDVSFCTKS